MRQSTAVGHVKLEKFAVSRVLYFQWYNGNYPPTIEATIIYLGHPLLNGSSDQPERPRARVDAFH